MYHLLTNERVLVFRAGHSEALEVESCVHRFDFSFKGNNGVTVVEGW